MVLHNFSVFNSQDRFGDEYKLFLLINPEDDKPVAVVVPGRTLQPETTGKNSPFYLGHVLKFKRSPCVKYAGSEL